MLKAIAVFVILNAIGGGNCCHSFKNITIMLVSQTGDKFNKTVDGCIERPKFNVTIVEAYVQGQNVTRMDIGTVQNMNKLKIVSFRECNTERIDNGAFRNAPRLSQIDVTHSKIKTIRTGAFTNVPSLEILRIANNEINVIEERAFNNLTNLKRLFIADNKLENISPKWFIDLVKLEILDFRRNVIQKIPASSFLNVPKLRRLDFDSNDIAEIAPRAFEGLINLQYLGLKYNRLKTIDSRMFPSGLKIELFNIGANKFNYLDLEALNDVAISNITFDGNPWKCPCMDKILFWISQRNIVVQHTPECIGNDIPVCVFSEPYTTTCMETVDEEATTTFLQQVRAAVAHNRNFRARKCARFE